MKRYLGLIMVVYLLLSAQSCSLFGGTKTGVYRSIDGGRTWQSINELKIKGEKTQNPRGNIYSIAVAKSNPDVIYVGTQGNGIYKSENKARTWKKVTADEFEGSGSIVYDIVVNPKDENVVYAAGIADNYGKIFKSSNGGAEWREIFAESQKELPVSSLAISSTNTKVLISGSATGGVYLSIDGGESWRHGGNFKPVVSVGIDSSNNRTLYVATKYFGAFKSINFGKTWRGMTINLLREKWSKSNAITIGRMAVAPSNNKVIYIGTTSGVFRSNNGGASWRHISTLLPDKDAPLVSDMKVNSKNPNIIYFSVPNIIYKAEDSGGQWISSQLSINARINKLAVDPTNSDVIYAGVGG